MKILHLCDSLNPAGLGGYESYLHYLSEQLAVKHHESIVVTQAARHDSPKFVDHEFYRIYNLPGNLLEARKWEFFSLPENERDAAAEEMFQADDLTLNVEALEQQLSDLIQSVEPDLIHAHSPYVVFNRVLEKIREQRDFKNLPMLATIHGRPKPLVLPGGERTTDYDAFVEVCPFDLILAVSDNVSEVLKRYLDERGKSVAVQTLYLGVDLSVFHPLNNTPKQWDLAFLGRLESMKSVDLFPEMLALLKPDFPELRFLMTGEGSLKNLVFDEFQQRGVADIVEYLGVVETERVPVLLNQSSVFIYPSREEPFGLSILEAMACETPVVTTNVFGPSEIITNNVDGLTVPPNDVRELVNAIGTLLTNDKLRSEIGRNARTTVEKRFDIKMHYDGLIQAYMQLIMAKQDRN
ncbi:MAG: glycosyltransferase family 4 protein [Candidatus Thorarchaeota archaeon]